MTDTSEQGEERTRRFRIRIKAGVAILLAYGYALVGGALWQPLTGAQPFDGLKLFLALLGLAMHAAAIYIAPKGEP